MDESVKPAVSLKEISAETVWPIMKLQVADQQRKFVASNAHSIAEAYFSERAWFRAIYHGDQPVGFVMLYIDRNKPHYFLWRLMIDRKHQRKGYGTQAMLLVIEHVRSLPGAQILETSYTPGDGCPAPFYYQLGFQETGEFLEGEKVLRLEL